jgi:hypothetical protein
MKSIYVVRANKNVLAVLFVFFLIAYTRQDGSTRLAYFDGVYSPQRDSYWTDDPFPMGVAAGRRRL